MQTFMPLPSFEASAAALDRDRLHKQCVEGLQVVNALTIPTKGWKSHVATRMWYLHPHALCDYVLACCREYRRRHGRDIAVRDAVERARDGLPPYLEITGVPEWVGDERVHSSHRTALLCKSLVRLVDRGDPRYFDHYASMGWEEADRLPASLEHEYFWPCAADGSLR